MPSDARKVAFHIARFDPQTDPGSRTDTFEVPVQDGWTVLDAIIYIKEQLDGTLGVRYSCRSGQCGSDGMVINGLSRLACKTRVVDLLARSATVTVEPLRHLPVLRDLAVQQDIFFAKQRAVERPGRWLQADDLDLEPKTPESEAARADAGDCISCQICTSVCPVEAADPLFVGPAALVRAFRLQTDGNGRWLSSSAGVLDGPHGAGDCTTSFHCTQACPQGIAITWDIQQLKNRAMRQQFRTGGERPAHV